MKRFQRLNAWDSWHLSSKHAGEVGKRQQSSSSWAAGAFNAAPGYETVDLVDETVLWSEWRWPFEDNSCWRYPIVWRIRALLKDIMHTMSETVIVFVLQAAWLIFKFQARTDVAHSKIPTHVSFWNNNSFLIGHRHSFGTIPDLKGPFDFKRLRAIQPQKTLTKSPAGHAIDESLVGACPRNRQYLVPKPESIR